MFPNSDRFENRHIGPSIDDLNQMLKALNLADLDALIDETIPDAIRLEKELDIPEAIGEYQFLQDLGKIASKNKSFRSFIGLGYYGTITPSVILRNVFENPGWYTQYTPYQAEIAQGRLEALLNFQTMVSDFTGFPIANASLLDEGTAAAEAMGMFYNLKNRKGQEENCNRFLVSSGVLPQTVSVLQSRAIPLGIQVDVVDNDKIEFDDSCFGLLLQYPAQDGGVEDYSELIAKAKAADVYVALAADILALALLKSPAELGADVALGNTQRFGVPMGFGGPHAAYFATEDDFKRQIPGRIIGVSEDVHNNPALRMALQTREQHIRRDKATSNICTAQALLAIMAGMYAVYHGADGIRSIATRIHAMTGFLAGKLEELGFELNNKHFFDTISIKLTPDKKNKIRKLAEAAGINFRYFEGDAVGISLDETCESEDLMNILSLFGDLNQKKENFADSFASNGSAESQNGIALNIPQSLQRKSKYLEHPVFSSHRSETKMMRYIKKLENKDLSLVHSMIPLGSCTMKLNAATQLMPVSWAAFSNLHPFVPADQAEGYREIFNQLEKWLCVITGFTAASLQPNSGAQGEFTGLLLIRAYHESIGESHRNIALIPESAHGTNPASAVMAGLKVVVVACDEKGNIDSEDLRQKAEKYKDSLSALMVTYPSTHGVFETGIRQICQTIHENGGLVYMDGANMNAQVGLTSPARIGADVCHLNLHKTFSIPHGGGGPGMGPVCVNDKLSPFLPGHLFAKTGGEKAIPSVSSAPWSSASILLISYAYIRLLGKNGLLNATKYAILNANYIKFRLEKAYSILYTGTKGRAAHELIVDLRPFKTLGVQAEDVAKRLIDFGFHAPTLSFPVAGTIMIEPTESEGKDELDRFCDAMLQIHKEIQEIATGEADSVNNVLHNSPHTLEIVSSDDWPYPYGRTKAAYPLPFVRESKFWAAVGRVNNTLGDRNLICTCPPIESYHDSFQE